MSRAIEGMSSRYLDSYASLSNSGVHYDGEGKHERPGNDRRREVAFLEDALIEVSWREEIEDSVPCEQEGKTEHGKKQGNERIARDLFQGGELQGRRGVGRPPALA